MSPTAAKRRRSFLPRRQRRRSALSALAETLTARRRATAEQVEEQIETALHDMEMKHARFHIQIEEKADWGADGKDKVETSDFCQMQGSRSSPWQRLHPAAK